MSDENWDEENHYSVKEVPVIDDNRNSARR